ncbi:hypothetical protein HanPI659440_Chr17g0678231 [Helianthus annuus]|nr:hypothetical protein HanPI659440_Chr17g0678231 [Helianthus annuus]
MRWNCLEIVVVWNDHRRCGMENPVNTVYGLVKTSVNHEISLHKL